MLTPFARSRCDFATSPNRKLAETSAVTLAFCWSHARRRFYEIAKPGGAPIATEALERIAKLYEIEAEIRGRDAGTTGDGARITPRCRL